MRQWSVRDLDGFWRSNWDHCDLQSPTPFATVIIERSGQSEHQLAVERRQVAGPQGGWSSLSPAFSSNMAGTLVCPSLRTDRHRRFSLRRSGIDEPVQCLMAECAPAACAAAKAHAPPGAMSIMVTSALIWPVVAFGERRRRAFPLRFRVRYVCTARSNAVQTYTILAGLECTRVHLFLL